MKMLPFIVSLILMSGMVFASDTLVTDSNVKWNLYNPFVFSILQPVGESYTITSGNTATFTVSCPTTWINPSDSKSYTVNRCFVDYPFYTSLPDSSKTVCDVSHGNYINCKVACQASTYGFSSCVINLKIDGDQIVSTDAVVQGGPCTVDGYGLTLNSGDTKNVCVPTEKRIYSFSCLNGQVSQTAPLIFSILPTDVGLSAYCQNGCQNINTYPYASCIGGNYQIVCNQGDTKDLGCVSGSLNVHTQTCISSGIWQDSYSLNQQRCGSTGITGNTAATGCAFWDIVCKLKPTAQPDQECGYFDISCKFNQFTQQIGQTVLLIGAIAVFFIFITRKD